jgi:phosphoribosylformylglycinamidine cyclo-ligase
MDDGQAYATFTMGAGFALYVDAVDAARCVEVARSPGVSAWVAGRVEAGPKQLVIEPLGVHWGADALQLR